MSSEIERARTYIDRIVRENPDLVSPLVGLIDLLMPQEDNRNGLAGIAMRHAFSYSVEFENSFAQFQEGLAETEQGGSEITSSLTS